VLAVEVSTIGGKVRRTHVGETLSCRLAISEFRETLAYVVTRNNLLTRCLEQCVGFRNRLHDGSA